VADAIDAVERRLRPALGDLTADPVRPAGAVLTSAV
jgi:hypothetical protein